MTTTCLCKNRPQCIWCGEEFENHGLLIIHSIINQKNIPNFPLNPHVNKRQSDYTKGMRRSF